MASSKEGVRYVETDTPGIRRRRAGKGFTYVDARGKKVSAKQRERIEALVIPPAWRDVWICPDPQGHIQVVGYDDEGRRQYLYHPEWRSMQDATKFDRMRSFGRALPALREVVRADLVRPGLPREKVVAAVVRAMEHTFTRVGSESYARDNGSFGMATMQDVHVVDQKGDCLELRFPAKSGKEQDVIIEDRRVAAVVRQCQELPGQRLFEYEDEDGEPHEVTSGDVNEYLKDALGDDYSSKDFRTWAATTLMTRLLQEAGARETKKEREVVIREAVKAVADRLGNTVAVCKKSYIHPVVPASYLDGSFSERVKRGAARLPGLWPEEAVTLRLLDSYETDAED